jgi:hypothetical protein
MPTLTGMNTSPAAPGIETPQQPHQYARRVLLAVSGLSAQIVTETIYALASNAAAPFVPTEVHVITTREGAQRAELSLLSDDLGWFHKLCADYHLPGITFNLAQAGLGDDSKATEAIYKMESLLKLGGLRTRGMVVDYRGELAKSEANQKRAKEAGIAIVSGAQLKDLKGHISRLWLSSRKTATPA